jgi:hypothetical protein
MWRKPVPDHLEEVDPYESIEKRGGWWSHRRRLWGPKKNGACTSNYYSEKEPKYVADFSVRIFFSTALELWVLRI